MRYEESPPSKIEISRLYRDLLIYISAWMYGVILISIYIIKEWRYIATTENLLLLGIFITASYGFIFLIILPDLKFIKSLKNYIAVLPDKNEFGVGEKKIPLSAVKKVIVDPDKLQISIYLSDGAILKYPKNTGSMFLLQFQKCMDALGIEFGIIRRTGRWWKSKEEVTRIKTMEDHRKARHEERYERRLEKC